MANTKNLSRQERKQARRIARKRLKARFAALSPALKNKFRKSEHSSLGPFLAEEESGDA